MARLRRLFVKGFGLPVMCVVLVTFMFVRHGSVYWRPVVNDNELIRVLQTLRTSNENAEVQPMNISISENSAKSQNISNDESAVDAQRKATRKLFDGRQTANSSKMSVSDHPLFPGYVIENPHVCNGENVDILVYLHSAVDHRESRRNIRESWASSRTFSNINVKLLFIVGRPSDSMTQFHVETEFSTYGDIVQGDFSDAFKNLTYKAITMLAWVNAHCSQVRYIVKVDDDMFVDMFRVVSEVIPKVASKKLAVVCDVKTDMPILRDPHIKWSVDETLLPGRKTWPRFCSGYFVVMTGETIPKLYEASFNVADYIPIDDAYLFGLLVERNVSVEFLNIHDNISVNRRPDPDKEINVNGKFEFISFQVGSHEDHTKLWALRSKKLSPWEQEHSNYFSILNHSKERTLLIV